MKKRLTVLTLLILLSFLALTPVFVNFDLEAQVPSTIIAEDSTSQVYKPATDTVDSSPYIRDFDSFQVVYWRWSDPQIDRWFEYDKLTHFVGFSWQYLFIKKTGMFKDKEVLCGTAISAVLWECKDALLPWEKYGDWGGDGFSYKDLIWSLAGIGISYWIGR